MRIAVSLSATVAPLALAWPPPPYFTATGFMLCRLERSSHSTPASVSVKLTHMLTPLMSLITFAIPRDTVKSSTARRCISALSV